MAHTQAMLCGRPASNVLFMNAVYGCDLPVSDEFRLLVPECGKGSADVIPPPVDRRSVKFICRINTMQNRPGEAEDLLHA